MGVDLAMQPTMNRCFDRQKSADRIHNLVKKSKHKKGVTLFFLIMDSVSVFSRSLDKGLDNTVKVRYRRAL